MEGDVSSSDGDANQSALKPQKPCDGCRQRKIRCDRKPPCSHCRAACIPCRTTRRVKEERTRVTISKQYENKIDGIDDRLARIEKLLREVNDSQSSPACNTASTRSSTTFLDDDKSELEHPVTSDFASTGHYRDTLAAKDILEKTITSNNDGLAQDPQLSSTLQALRKIVSKIDADGKEMPSPQATPEDDGAEMPAWGTIEKLLARGRADPPEAWELYVILIPMDEFVTMCERLHRDKHHGSIAQHTIVYAGLYCLVSEFASEETGEEATLHWNMGLKFVRLAIDTISQLPLLAPAKRDNIIALLISSILAIDLAKPYLSWQLNTIAIKMCQTLGYHRAAAMSKVSQAERERHMFIFWNCYVMDRNLALRLGRAPTIPDFDITSPVPVEVNTSSISVTVVHMLEYWVRVARVQGQICDSLYSPAALHRAERERAETARKCRDELEKAHAQRMQLQDIIKPPKLCNTATMLDPILAGDSLMHHSTLTLVLQAVATTPDTRAEALRCARDCLRTSIGFAKQHGRNMYSWIVYIHWVVLHAPMMTPFTAIFCHIIGNAQASEAAADLKLLQDFIATLEPARPLCQGTDRFVQLCVVFYDAARLYVQLKTSASSKGHNVANEIAQTNDDYTMSVEEFDRVLADMGLANTSDPPHGLSNNLDGNYNATDSLQGWYNANSSLYNLLDQEFGNFGDFGFDPVSGNL